MVACSTTRMVGADSTAVPMGPEVVPEVVVLVSPSGTPGSPGAVPVLEPLDAIHLGCFVAGMVSGGATKLKGPNFQLLLAAAVASTLLSFAWCTEPCPSFFPIPNLVLPPFRQGEFCAVLSCLHRLPGVPVLS
jgi:hypothetical protein